jgi:hypothetical protein
MITPAGKRWQLGWKASGFAQNAGACEGATLAIAKSIEARNL